jgi:hypothetical protein
VAQAKLFQLVEQLLAARFIKTFDPAAAVGGHDAELVGVRLQQPWGKWAAAGLQQAQDPGFLLEAFKGGG